MSHWKLFADVWPCQGLYFRLPISRRLISSLLKERLVWPPCPFRVSIEFLWAEWDCDTNVEPLAIHPFCFCICLIIISFRTPKICLNKIRIVQNYIIIFVTKNGLWWLISYKMHSYRNLIKNVIQISLHISSHLFLWQRFYECSSLSSALRPLQCLIKLHFHKSEWGFNLTYTFYHWDQYVLVERRVN